MGQHTLLMVELVGGALIVGAGAGIVVGVGVGPSGRGGDEGRDLIIIVTDDNDLRGDSIIGGDGGDGDGVGPDDRDEGVTVQVVVVVHLELRGRGGVVAIGGGIGILIEDGEGTDEVQGVTRQRALVDGEGSEDMHEVILVEHDGVALLEGKEVEGSGEETRRGHHLADLKHHEVEAHVIAGLQIAHLVVNGADTLLKGVADAIVVGSVQVGACPLDEDVEEVEVHAGGLVHVPAAVVGDEAVTLARDGGSTDAARASEKEDSFIEGMADGAVVVIIPVQRDVLTDAELAGEEGLGTFGFIHAIIGDVMGITSLAEAHLLAGGEGGLQVEIDDAELAFVNGAGIKTTLEVLDTPEHDHLEALLAGGNLVVAEVDAVPVVAEDTATELASEVLDAEQHSSSRRRRMEGWRDT